MPRDAITFSCALGLCVVLCFSGCHRQQKTGTVIARVGENELTLEEVKTAVDTSGDTFDSRLRGYVASWINSQLLFQEAQRQGVKNSESFQRQLADAERQLAVQQFLQQRVYSDTIIINDDALHAYFDAHSEEFFVHEDMMKMNLIAFTNRERAASFATSISRGATWKQEIEQVMADSTSAAGVISFATNKYCSQQTLFPTELWKVALTLATNEISFPVKTLLGYFVLQPLAMVRQGKPEDFELAKEEIRERLLIEKRRQRYNDLLGTLHKQYSVEVLLPIITHADTVPNSAHE